MSQGKVTAVFDIGKTNKKFFFSMKSFRNFTGNISGSMKLKTKMDILQKIWNP